VALALIAGWLGALLLVTALALPLTAWAFPDWPDGGAALAPAAAFAILTLSAYWVGHLAVGPHLVLVGAAVLACLSALALRAGVTLPRGPLLTPLAVFLAAFALMLGIRTTIPGITPFGGEQFLDFALINAVRRAPTLPPQDIWFAGESLRYYYGGPLLTALFTWLTDTPTRFAYNLMGPTLFASLATAAYGVTGAIADARGTSPRLAGILGAGMVALAGHLATPLRGLSSFLPRDLVAEYGVFLYGGIRAPSDEAVEAARFLGPSQFSFWEARHVIPGAPSAFPFWTYVNGDLRPHMYAGPFLLLAIALALAYYRTPEEARTRRRLLLFGTLPAVGGVLGVINSFDLPVVVGLAWLAVYFADSDVASLLPARLRAPIPSPRPTADGGLTTRSHHATGQSRATLSRIRSELLAVTGATAAAVLVGGLAVLWAAPLILGNTPTNRGIALLGPTSNLGGLVLVFGGFLAAIALWLAPRAVEGWARWRRVSLGLALGALLGASTLVGYPAVGLFAPVALGGWWLLRTGRARSFAVVLAIGGAVLALVPEFAYAVVWPYDPNAPRWNTVYKITMQVWTLWGVAAGVALAAVFGRARAAVAGGLSGLRDSPVTLSAGLAAALLVVLLAAFPAFAVGSFVDDATGADGDLQLGLNASGEAADVRPGEVAAARWLRQNTTGQPIVVSKPAGHDVYNWDGGANTLSTFSGVPTLAGWEHAAGYHGLDAYEQRLRVVDRIYSGEPTVVRRLLRRHDVDYVHVGPAEREAYGVRAFAMEFQSMEVAYRNNDVTIYAVNQTMLSRGDTSGS
jgi:YYY domain-containing protein